MHLIRQEPLQVTIFKERFDTDGSAIIIGQTTLTSKGTIPKEYQTPYGATTVSRHVYQSAKGGKTFCPLEREARIVTSATPRFAFASGAQISLFHHSR